MNEVIVQTLYFMASYVGLFLIIFFVLNWLTKGFILSFLKVKASQGKKILSMVHSATDVYFSVGSMDDLVYNFKRRDKKKSVVTNVKDKFFSMCGVFVLSHSEDGKTIYTKEGKAFEGNDGRTVDNYLNRIIKSPQLEDNFRKFLLILNIILVLGVGAALYFLFVIYDKIKVLQAAGVIQ